MPQEEVAPDRAHFLSKLPIRFEWPPVVAAQETRYEDDAIVDLNSSAPTNVFDGAPRVDRVSGARLHIRD
jgi:hypothetical protein